MQEQRTHTLFVAHSNKNYVLGLTIGFTGKGYLINKHTVSGIEALEYILQFQPKFAIIEAELPLLSAFDIIKTVQNKEIKTQFIVALKTRELPILQPLQYVNINEVYYCNMHVKTLLKVVSKLNKPKNLFWNLLVRKFQEIRNKKIKTIKKLSNYEISLLLNLANNQNTNFIIQDTNASSILLTKTNLKTIALKLNLAQQQISLKEWSINNNAILMAFSLSSTT